MVLPYGIFSNATCTLTAYTKYSLLPSQLRFCNKGCVCVKWPGNLSPSSCHSDVSFKQSGIQSDCQKCSILFCKQEWHVYSFRLLQQNWQCGSGVNCNAHAKGKEGEGEGGGACDKLTKCARTEHINRTSGHNISHSIASSQLTTSKGVVRWWH